MKKRSHSQQEEEYDPDIRVVQVRTSQTGSELVTGDTEEDQAQTERNQGDTGSQENSYEGHQEDLRHREFHTDELTSSNLSTLGADSNSTFKAAPPSSLMEARQEKGVTGLANMRNTCYMNSALQALRHNTEISAFFLENKHEQWLANKPGSAKVELVKGYSDLLRSLWSGSKPSYIRPLGFIQTMLPAAVEAGFDQFQVPLQHDSHEFLTFLLDQLHEGMAEEVNIEINRPRAITQQDKAIQGALEAWKRMFSKQYSPFTEMIYGLFRITMTCQNCHHSSDAWETFNCLKVPISKSDEAANFMDLLKEEFHEETIEGYACEKCSPTRTTATRRTFIWRLPRMVVLVLKRFTPDGKKIYTNFKFPEEPIVFKQFFSLDSPEPSQHQPYECFATVDHHGSSGGGHYTAQAKSPLTDKWNMFDDETASSISEPHYGISTYIVFLKPSSKAAEA